MAWPNTVRKSDLRIDYYRGSGAGGQHRNKTDSACRITHLPTKIVAQAEDERYQHQNRRLAFRRLCAKLVPLMRQAHQSEKQKKVTERVRTYHEPRNQVKDERVKGKTWSYSTVVDGNGLDDIISQLK